MKKETYQPFINMSTHHTKKQVKQILIVVFILLVAILLIGQRFGFTFAGGGGYLSEVSVNIIYVSRTSPNPSLERRGILERGSSVVTNDEEYLLLELGLSAVIALDERTEIILHRLYEDEIVIKLVKGRIMTQVADGYELSIMTNFTTSTVRSGQASFVNYDFLEMVSVLPMDNEIKTELADGQLLSITLPTNIHETDPVEITDTTFDPTSETFAEFYSWVPHIF